MRTDEDGFVPFDRGDGNFLERIEFEGVGTSWLCWRDVRGDGNVGIVRREGDLMTNLRNKERNTEVRIGLFCERGEDRLRRD